VQHEAGVFPWEEFRRELIAQVARAEAAGGPFEYYETWLAAFEGVLAAKGLVRADGVEESAYAFEYGERDDVY
jgi:nitrile hydratase accessory protein